MRVEGLKSLITTTTVLTARNFSSTGAGEGDTGFSNSKTGQGYTGFEGSADGEDFSATPGDNISGFASGGKGPTNHSG